MKIMKLTKLYLSILICALALSTITISPVHAAHTIPGVQRLEEGIAAYEHGEYDEAIFKLEMAVYQISEEEKDQLWDAHFYLGLSYFLSGYEEEAKKEFIAAQGIIMNKSPDSDIHSPRIVKQFKEASEVKTSVIPNAKLRSTSRVNLSKRSVKSMLKDKGFYAVDWNNSTSGFRNDYKLQNNGKVVYDRASGLTWQQSGSDKMMRYKNAKTYVTKLNSDWFAGYNDWRLPTLEEAMSLMESSDKNGVYVDSVFDKTQLWIWTSDQDGAFYAWVVIFLNGDCNGFNFYNKTYVRAVR
jgi:tetratricopeptide (TPR) repeat protein